MHCLLVLPLSVDAVHGQYFGTSSTTPLYTNSRCSGQETSYSECSRVMTSSCVPGIEDVGVVCSSKRERERAGFILYVHVQCNTIGPTLPVLNTCTV